MPSRRGQRQTAEREQAHYPAMMRIAGEMGCNLAPTERDPTVLKGLCPFHEATTRKVAHTLEVNTRSLRFACMYCHAAGPPSAFAAMAWNVSARDARELLESHGAEAGAERPLYRRTGDAVNLANTAVLTRAAAHYRNQVFSGTPLAMPALSMAAGLGLTLTDATRAGMGMSTGQGLAEALRETGVSEEEMRDSPLFENGDTRRESMAGRVTLADNDYTGGTIWITTFNPYTGPALPYMSERRPNTMGLPGPRPQLVGSTQAGGRRNRVVLTDDARLYLVLKAAGKPVTLWAGRVRDGGTQGKRDAALRVVRGTERIEAKEFVLMMHDSALRSMCLQAMEEQRPGISVHSLGKREIMRQLSPHTRDLENIVRQAGRELRDPRPPEEHGEGEF